jgi:hypothetical protein
VDINCLPPLGPLGASPAALDRGPLLIEEGQRAPLACEPIAGIMRKRELIVGELDLASSHLTQFNS